MLDIDDYQEAKLIADALNRHVLNTHFRGSTKTELQVAIIRVLIDAGVISFEGQADPNVALRLGMDPRDLSSFIYKAFLREQEMDIDSLAVSAKHLEEWNATTEKDVKQQEFRFEVPNLIARTKLLSYLSRKGIQAEDGRNRMILKVSIERVIQKLNENGTWPEEADEILRASVPQIANTVSQEMTTGEKLKCAVTGTIKQPLFL